MAQVASTTRRPASVRVPAVDRRSVAIYAVFLLAGAFYLWTAATTFPLALNGARIDPYNQLTNAFLHFHLSVGRAPAGLVHLPEPYNPEQNTIFQGFNGGIHDFALYHGKLFLTWGPTPAVVFLIPLHLLGLEPSSSVTASFFAIVGLGFALSALRVVVRQIGDVPVWMCVLAACTLALASAIPFILRRPAVYEEEIAAGYCFTMVSIWLAVCMIVDQRASLSRLASMSLCVGLATAARPTLLVSAVVLVAVYLSLRGTRPRRGLLLALTIPLGVCVLLLLVYNQARFGSPLENGAKYQLAGFDQHVAHFGDLANVLPGLWFYGLNLPRAITIFPFIILTPQPISYPGSLPTLYRSLVEATGGLLPMAPILVFAAALPWMWRRETSLGRLARPLIMLTGAGVVCALFLVYEFFSATERYEVDFTTLLLFGALAGWLALSNDAHGWQRRLVRIGGGSLAAWSCVAGLAISFTGYYNLLASAHPGTWKTLEDLSAPVSRAIAVFKRHPVLAEVVSANFPALAAGERAELVIVSPDSRRAALLANWVPAVGDGHAIYVAKYGSTVLIRGPGRLSAVYPIAAGGEMARIPVHLSAGLNRVEVVARASEASGSEATPGARQLLYVKSFALASHY